MISKLLNIKGVITISLILFILSLIGTTTYLYKKNQELNVKVSDQSIQLKAKGQGTINFVDDNGKLHSQSIQYGTTIANLKASKDSLDKAFLDMVAEYEVKIKDLTQAGQVTTTTVYSPPKIHYVATAKDTTYNLSKLPFIIDEIHIKDDSLSSHLEIFNKQAILWHTKRETIDPPKKFFLFRWFQKKHDVTYVDIVNDNPFIQTTGQNFQIINK